jgi:coenzyme F420-0:L-glutamate ligase/coenzyme F420-1:gamma-L-glutamate ligase
VIKMRCDVRILGLKGFPLVKPGDDIAELILMRARSLRIRIADGDVLIIGHKIISKSEGRIARLYGIKPSRRAVKIARRCLKDPRLVQLILTESRRILKVKPGILLVETKHGIACLSAGIDRSNVEGSDMYCLLPKNPKLSAARIAKRILERTGKRVEAIVTDTYSRPFRVGQCEFAIGASGLDPFVDYRGTKDLFGKVLKFKRVSIADELACAGELVMGQGAEGIPVAIIKGTNRIGMSDRNVGSRLTMERGRDLFRGAL